MATEKKEKTSAKSSGKGGLLGLLIPCLAVVLLAGGAGVAARVLLAGPGDPTQPGAVKPEIVVPEVENEPLEYYNLKPITVNANVPRRDRHIRATITLALPASVFGKVSQQIDKRGPEVRNWLTLYLSGLSLEDVGGPENYNRIREDIRRDLNTRLWPDTDGLIREVLLDEFAIQ